MSEPIDRRTLAASFTASVVLGSEALSAETPVAPRPHAVPAEAAAPQHRHPGLLVELRAELLDNLVSRRLGLGDRHGDSSVDGFRDAGAG